MKIYTDLDIELKKGTFNALRPNSYFESKNANKLSDYVVFEFLSEGVYSKREDVIFQQKLTKFKEFSIKRLKSDKKRNFLIKFGDGVGVKSRIRSYKGLLDKTRVNNRFIEIEKSISEETSIFLSVVEVTDFNDYLFELFLDDSTCFIIHSDIDYCSESIFDRLLLHTDMDFSTLNFRYIDLVCEFKNNGDYIAKVGGDHGEEYWSLQIFCTKDHKEIVLKSLESK